MQFWSEVYFRQISDDMLTPVCAPALASQIKEPSDIQNHPLIAEHPSYYDEWPQWFLSHDISYESKPGWQYDDTGVQIQAAIDGRGILLARENFVEECLKSGCLVKLFSADFRSAFQYYFVCPQERLQEPIIKSFHDWLFAVS